MGPQPLPQTSKHVLTLLSIGEVDYNHKILARKTVVVQNLEAFYSYENEFLDKLVKEGKRKLARMFNLSYRYIDDLISFNNKDLRSSFLIFTPNNNF